MPSSPSPDRATSPSADPVSSYRFAGPFVVRLTGLALALAGLLVVLLALLVAVLSLPGVVLLVGVVVALAAAVAVGLAAQRGATVVRFDETGYRVRYVRGTGVPQGQWKQVEDVATSTVAGERCVVLRLRDGRTTTIPVGLLAGRTETFVEDLRAHLDRGHGYRKVNGPRG